MDPELIAALARTRQLHIVACGTSYHAGLVMKYHFEQNATPTSVEYASEYLYRDIAVPPDTLFISLSQSGETADTLAALEKAKKDGRYHDNLAICNVPESALTRAANHTILTRAGREIGVASTKAFVTQLAVLHLVNAIIAAEQGRPFAREHLQTFDHLPRILQHILTLEPAIARAAKTLEQRHGCLYLGRGENYAIAAEGALKLKELTYIHAEAHPAGELKHGPLALVDENMPVLALIKHDALTEKISSNLEVVQARGGRGGQHPYQTRNALRQAGRGCRSCVFPSFLRSGVGVGRVKETRGISIQALSITADTDPPSPEQPQ